MKIEECLVRAIASETEDTGLLSIIIDIAEIATEMSPEDAAKYLGDVIEEFRQLERLDMIGNLLCELGVAAVARDLQAWHLECGKKLSERENYRQAIEAICDAMNDDSLIHMQKVRPDHWRQRSRFPYRRTGG